jgi:hypothetical protein
MYTPCSSCAITRNSETYWSLPVLIHRLLIDVMQQGRILWVHIQHHVKMLMIADDSSAALLKIGSKVLQNVSTLPFQHSAIPKHLIRNTNCLSLDVGRLSTNRNNQMNLHIITYRVAHEMIQYLIY